MTLIELMSAIIILGIIMMAMARTLITSLASVQAQERQMLGSGVVSEVLERAQGLPYRSVGLCQGAVTTFFGTSAPNHVYEDPNPPNATLTEPVVVIRDDDPYCDSTMAPLGPPALQPEQTLVRRGVEYTVETIVSWFDDPADGLGASDMTGIQDIKHVVVTATWPSRSATRSMTSETFIAPPAGSEPLVTRIVHNPPTGSPAYSYLDANGLLTSSIVLTARTLEPVDSVQVRWLQRDGTTYAQPFLNPTSSAKIDWELTLVASPYTFRNGETIFEFEATDAAGSVATFNRGLFVHTEPVITEISTDPTTVQVDTEGNVCPFELRMTGFGLLPTDVTEIVFDDGLPAGTLAFPSGSPTASGSDFSTTIEGGPGFVAGTSESVTINVQRVNDEKTDEEDHLIPVSSTVVASC